MTKREFYSFVAENVDNKEIVEMAKLEIALLDNKNARAKEKRMKNAEANEPIEMAIREYLAEHNSALASELATFSGVSTSKVVAVANKMTEIGIITCKKVKITKVGERNSYSLAK